MATETAQFDSDLLRHGSYDAEAQELRLTFVTTGQVYSYANVPRETWDALKGASSSGGYFHRFIRNQYQARPL